MLSVMRAASEAAGKSAVDEDKADVLSLWGSAFRSATDALYETPSQLPILKEAGVVDAGGLGVVVILGGALCSLTGRDWDLVDQAVAACCVEPVGSDGAQPSIDANFLDASLESTWGYCIQYVIDGAGPAVEQVRAEIGQDLDQSAVIVGDSRYVRVHVHALDPGTALTFGASFGQLEQIKVENMGQQNSQFVAGHQSVKTTQAALVVVAVAQGSGLARLFRDTGCAGVIDGGQTMNPSVGQFLDAAKSTGSQDVIVLPNNPNVVSTARQSAGANPNLHVVPSKTVPQGVAALLAFSPESTLEHNLKAMSDVLNDVVSIEVTQAVRSSTIGGVDVAEGQFIGLLEGELATSGDTPELALMAALDRAGLSSGLVVTIYQGELASGEAAQEMCQQLQRHTPGMQVDLLNGGQPHYHYLASVE